MLIFYLPLSCSLRSETLGAQGSSATDIQGQVWESPGSEASSQLSFCKTRPIIETLPSSMIPCPCPSSFASFPCLEPMSRPCSLWFVLTMPPFCTPANWLSDLPCEYKLLYPAHSIYGLESQSDFCCLPVCCTPALSCSSYLLKAWAPLQTRACMLKSVFLCFPLHSTVCSSLFLCCTLLLTMDWSLFWIQSTLCFCFMFVQGLVEA